MEKKLYLRILIMGLLLCCNAAYGQFVKLERPLSDSSSPIDTASNSDSVKMAEIQQQLEAALLSEANLKLEIEHLKMKDIIDDSIKLIEQKLRIDSLRQTYGGAPVVVESDTLFILYAKNGGWLPELRAKNTAAAITQVGKMFTVKPDSVYIETSDYASEIMYGQDVLLSLSDNDAMWAGCSRDSLAISTRYAIVAKLEKMKEEHGLFQLFKRLALLVAVILGIWILLKITNRLFRMLYAKIELLRDSKLKPINIQDYELLDTQKQVQILQFLARILRYGVIILVLVLTVPLIFSIFPATKSLAMKIFSYIWDPVSGIFASIVDYIPNLFTICVIFIVIKYLVRFFKYISNELANERLKIKGFYPDWAIPTYYIIRFLLYAFMIAMIYPYLPGANSGIFQGMSVFIGIIVSLGSSAVIGNIIYLSYFWFLFPKLNLMFG